MTWSWETFWGAILGGLIARYTLDYVKTRWPQLFAAIASFGLVAFLAFLVYLVLLAL